VAREEEFWVQKKQERRVACTKKRRKKKAWIEAEYNNPNMELDDENLRWLEYNFLTSEDNTDKE
jgi:hypothetical protein